MKESCYMCNALKTSVEHVPPKCIFPETKDDNSGKNHRKNLITVPSCNKHNTAKSGDDEYFMMVISSYFANNESAQSHIKTKISRAWKRNPKLAKTVCKNIEPVKGKNLYAFEIDSTRLDSVLIHIAHGLYFHQYKRRSNTPFKIMSYPIHENFLVNNARKNIIELAEQLFTGVQLQGENPEIFSFQISTEIDNKTLIKMVFYEAFIVIMSNSTKC